jgi:hypothetical protein
VAYETIIVFGKQQDKDFKKYPLANRELTLLFYINPKNILVHSKYNGDHSGGYDIALIGFDSKHDYYKIE